MEEISLEYTDVFDKNKIKNIKFETSKIKEKFNEKSLFATMVDGKSMQPLISHKAVLIVDISNKQLIDDEIYLLYYENKMWVKKYDSNKKSFISINPSYKHLVYDLNSIHLVGKLLLFFNN